jgi:hypothetical protein
MHTLEQARLREAAARVFAEEQRLRQEAAERIRAEEVRLREEAAARIAAEVTHPRNCHCTCVRVHVLLIIEDIYNTLIF